MPNDIELKAYMKELQAEKKKYTRDGLEQILKLYGIPRRGRGEPDVITGSSFLYIRSYDGDNGNRPFGGITFWNSPDINISPVTLPEDFTTTLKSGNTYNINVRVHNRGDMIVYNPKMEFFLTDPTLGFNTTVAKKIGTTVVPGNVLQLGTNQVNFAWFVPPEEEGHKCFFARTYSFSPLDIPVDLNGLDPTLDRHIAQKNLNFVPQGSAYMFNIVHQPNAFETIGIVALNAQQVFDLQHPALKGKKPSSEGRVVQQLLRTMKLEPIDKFDGKISRNEERQGWTFETRDDSALNLDHQSRIYKQMEGLISSVYAGKTNFKEHRAEVKEFREMNRHVKVTRLMLQIPNFELQPGEVVAFDIVNTNQLTGKMKGGITVVVMG